MRTAGVTVSDVARTAGVSKTTAVYVLNDKPGFSVPDATRRRVREVAQQLGYRRNGVAAALSRGRIQAVGVVVPVPTSVQALSSFSLVYPKDVLIAVTDAARGVGLRVTLVPQDAKTALSVEEVTDGRVDGLILVSLRDEAFTRAVYATGFPCVSIGTGYAERPLGIDNRGGVLAAVDHLVGLGHRRIAHGIYAESSRVARERRDAFDEGIARHGLDPSECPVYSGAAELFAAVSSPDPDRRPTALVAFNDLHAFEAVKHARRGGVRVPEDLSVVGFDNNLLAEACFPPLTTVYNPLAELAAEAIQILQCLWRGETDVPLPPPLPTRLVVRESTAVPPPSKEKP